MELTAVLILSVIAIVLNLPFGYYRMGVRKYSLRWFLAIHLPIPAIIILRLVMGAGWRVVPFLFVFAVIGQIAGGIIRLGINGGPVVEPVRTDAASEDKTPLRSVNAGVADSPDITGQER